jgi:hypothetical protein
MRKLSCLLLFICAISTQSAFSRPQYSALFGQSCFLCHVNPTGNGMRELYGSQFFGPQYLPVKPVSFELINKLKPQLSESVKIGADLRTIWLATNTQEDETGRAPEEGTDGSFSTNTGNIAQMEGSMYLEIRPTEQMMIYLSRGVADASGRMEAYGMVNLKGFKAWCKGGQFQENYGYRFADHTSYVRTGLWSGYDGYAFSAPLPPHYGVGFEAGTRIATIDISTSYTAAQSNIPSDRDQQKRWFARAYGQRRLPFAKKFVVNAGGSWYHSPGKAPDPELPFSLRQHKTVAWGGFGGIAFEGFPDRMGSGQGASNFGWLATTLLFEYDRKNWSPNFAGFPVMSAYSTTQLDVMVYQGVWLQAAYDWLDNDESSKSSVEAERTSIGIASYVLPWVEVSLRHRLYSSEGDPASGGTAAT